MTEAEYLVCEDPRAMRDLLQAKGLETEEKWRAWVEACREEFSSNAPISIPWGEVNQSIIDEWLTDNGSSNCPFPVRCSFIREIWGNPFRPIFGVNCAKYRDGIWHEIDWLTPEVIAMALTIHNTQDWGLMPIFADLLEDAGCDNEDVLHHARNEERKVCQHCEGDGQAHGADRPFERRDAESMKCPVCKGTGVHGWIPARAPHVRGCWLLSLITGDES